MNIPNVDLIVVCSHIAPQNPVELTQIYHAIRSFHQTTPLVLLSGHSHMTYFDQYDENCFTLESGKYFEVIGLIQFDLKSGMQNLQTQWINTTVDNFVELAGTSPQGFSTPQGNQTKAMITKYSALLGLDVVYGCSPNTYWPDGGFEEATSLYRLLVTEIVPKTVFNYTASKNTQFYLTNTASLRYALYEGVVNRNDIYTISPFNDTFVYFQGIKGATLKQLMHAIDNTSGLAVDRCPPRLRNLDYDDQPNWYYSETYIDDWYYYDLVAASYDAQTILPVVEQISPNNTNYVSYPTELNGTGALQVYIQTYFKCNSTKVQ